MSEEPTKIGSSLERFLRLMGAPPVSTLTSLESQWPQLVGPALCDHTRPIEVIDGVLTIGCNDPSWASQIKWMDASIKRQFSELFEGQSLRRIHVRVTT